MSTPTCYACGALVPDEKAADGSRSLTAHQDRSGARCAGSGAAVARPSHSLRERLVTTQGLADFEALARRAAAARARREV